MRIVFETPQSQNNVGNLLLSKTDKKTNDLKLKFINKVIDNIAAKKPDLNLKSLYGDIDLLNKYNSKLSKSTKRNNFKNSNTKPKKIKFQRNFWLLIIHL